MRRIHFLILTLLSVSFPSFSQKSNDFLVGGAFDLIKTDNEGFIQKAQVGGEFNYFITRNFTATGGLDIWADNVMIAVVGARWYPLDHFFTRARGLIGKNDLSLGATRIPRYLASLARYPGSQSVGFEIITSYQIS